jgi:TP901 family phage tail tape measure protein
MALELDGNFDKLIKSVDRLVDAMGKVEKSLERSQRQVSDFDRAFGNTKKFDRFIKSLSGLPQAQAKSFDTVANGISKIARALKDIPDKSTGIDVLSRSLRAFVGGISDIQLPSEDVLARFKTLTQAVKALASLAAIDTSKVKIDPAFISQIRQFMLAIGGIEGRPDEKVGVISRVINGLKNIVFGNAEAKALEQFVSLSGSLAKLGPALKAITSAVEGTATIPKLNIGNVLKTFGKLGAGLKVISFVLSALPGGKAVDDFSRQIQRLGIGLSGLSAATKGVHLDSVKRMIAALALIGTSVKGISGLLRFNKDTNSKALIDTLVGIARAMRLLAGIRSSKSGTTDSDALKKQVEAIVKIINALRKLKGVQVPNVAELVKAIGFIFKSLDTSVKANKGAVVDFEKFIDRVIKSLAKLNSIKVDQGKATAIGKQLEALSKLDELQRKSGAAGAAPARLNNFFDVTKAILFSSAIQSAARAVVDFFDKLGRLPTQAGRAIEALGHQFDQMGIRLTDMGHRIENLLGISTLAQSGGFQAAIGFDDLSRQLEVFGNIQGETLKQAQDFANEIGIKYPLSSNEALAAILDLVKAGQDLSDVTNILPSAADLASLSESKSIQNATKFLIGARGSYRQFSDEVVASFDNVATASDIVFAAANVSTASIDGLFEALLRAGPAAARVGLNLEDAAAFITQFEDAGIRGVEAGTLLRTVLTEILKPKAAKEFERLGVAVTDANGNIRPFNDIIKDLNRRYAELGLSQIEINSSVRQLGDTFAQQGISILLARNGIDGVVQAMSEVEPAATAAQTILESLRGQILQLQGSAESLLTRAFLPMINRFFTPVVKALRAVVDGFNSLSDPILEVASTTIFFASALASIAGSGLVVVGVLTRMSGIVQIIGGRLLIMLFNLRSVALVLGSFLGGLAIAIPTILALSAGVAGLSVAINDTLRFIKDNVGGAGDAFVQFAETVQGIFGQIGRILQTAALGIGAILEGIFGTDTQRGEAVASLFNQITDALRGVLDFLGRIKTSDIVFFLLNMKNAIVEIATNVRHVLAEVSAGVGDFFGPIQQAIDRFLPELRLTISTILEIFDPIQEQAADFPIIRTLVGLVGFVRSVIVGQIQEITNILIVFNRAVLLPIRDNLPAIINGIRRFVGIMVRIFRPIGEFLGAQALAFITFLNTLRNSVDNLPAINQAFERFVQQLIEGFRALPQTIGRVIARVGEAIGSDLLFYLGRAMVRGDLGPFIESLRQTIIRIPSQIADLLIRIGQDSGLGLVTALGQAIRGGDAYTIIITAFDALFEVIVSVISAALKSVGDALSGLFGNLFGNVENSLDQQQPNILRSINDFILGLTAPVRAIFSVFARGLDLGAFVLEVAAGVVRDLVVNLTRILPGIFFTLADVVADAALKNALRSLGNFVAGLTRSLGALLAFPIRFLSSFFNALSAFIDLLDRLGLTQGPALLIITSLTLSFTGLGRALLFLLNNVILRFFGPAIIQLRIFGFAARDAVVPHLIALKTAVVNFAIAFANAFRGFLAGEAGAIAAGFRGIGLAVLNAGRAGWAGLIASIRALGVSLKSLIAAVAPLVLLAAALVTIKAAMDGFADAAQNGLSSGVLKFFESLATTVLDLLGLSHLIPQVQENFRMLEIIINEWFERVQKAWQKVFDSISIGFIDLQSRIEELGGGTARSDQFFALQDLFKQAGQLSGHQFFTALQGSLSNPADINVVRTQMRVNANTILGEFASAFVETGGDLGRLAPNIRKSLILALDLSDSVRSAFDLASQGGLEPVLNLFRTLEAEGGRFAEQNIADFFEVAIANGLDQASLATEDERQRFRQLIISAVELGEIDENQAAGFLRSIGFEADAILVTTGALADRFAVLDSTIGELFDQVQQSNLETLNRELEEGKISAEEYAEALTNLGEEIINNIDALRQQQLSALLRQFNEGLISEQEFREGLEAINAEARNTTIAELNEEIVRLGDAAQSGLISMEAAAGGIAAIQEQLEQFGSVPSNLQTELDQLFADFATGVVDAAKFAIEFQRIMSAIEDARNAVSEPPSTLQRQGDDEAPVFSDTGELAGEWDDTLEEMSDALEEFRIDESRRLDDELRAEKKKADDIQEIRDDAARDEKERIDQFNIDRQRQAQDHQIALAKIAKAGEEQFEDAIAGRDASAAQQAEKQTNAALAEETSQFAINDQRRAEDLAREIEQNRIKAALRVAEAQQELFELQQKHERERQERQADFDRKHAQEATQNAVLEQQQDAHNKTEQQQRQQSNAVQATQNQQFLNNVVSTLTNARSNFGTFVDGIRQAVFSLGMQNGPLTFLQQVFQSISGFISQFAQNILGFFGGGGQQQSTNPIQQAVGALFGGNRAFGGGVGPGQLFRVGDRFDGRPELLRSGRDTFLLPGRSGMVTPPAVAPRAAAAGVGGFNVSLDFSGMVIQGGNSDPSGIASMIEERVIPRVTETIRKLQQDRRRL